MQPGRAWKWRVGQRHLEVNYDNNTYNYLTALFPHAV